MSNFMLFLIYLTFYTNVKLMIEVACTNIIIFNITIQSIFLQIYLKIMFRASNLLRSSKNLRCTLERYLSENATIKSKKIGLVGMGNVGNIYFPVLW